MPFSLQAAAAASLDPAMELTSGQEAGLAKLRAFLETPRNDDDISTRILTISGAAGTGKTTLLGFASALVDQKVVVCAPTNKACAVLRRKGFPRATTLERVLNKHIYKPVDRPLEPRDVAYYESMGLPVPATVREDEFEKLPKDTGGITVLLDEASMTGVTDIKALLLLFDKIVFVGDGFQLPPVSTEENPVEAWFQSYSHDVTLTEIVRTAADNAITHLAHAVRRRDRDWMTHPWGDEVQIIRRRDTALFEAALYESDVVLARRNDTCDHFNAWVRDLRGLAIPGTMQPVPGDKLLAWQARKPYIYKSEVYEVHGASPCMGGFNVRLKLPDGLVELVAVNESSLRSQLNPVPIEGLLPMSFGHAITTHKSQASEWDRVVVLAYDKPASHADYWNWLYTACTRARKRLTIVTK